MNALDRVLGALETRECRPRGNDTHGYKALCPAHEDRNPSLKIDHAEGRVLLKCYAECPATEVVAALGLDWSDLFDEALPERSGRGVVTPKLQTKRVVDRYDYTDEDGQLLYQVERMDPKGFRQRRPDATGGWQYSLGDVRRVPFHLPALLDELTYGEGRVVIVEGEKDVLALESLNVTATTNAGGAGKWAPEFSELLTGATVAIIQDFDAPSKATGIRPGSAHAEAIARSLQGVAAKVTLLEPAVGSDVADHLNAGLKLGALLPAGTRAARDEQAEAAPEPEEIKPSLIVMTAREIAALPPPDKKNHLLGALVERSKRLMIAGATGHGKTTMTLAMVAAIVKGEKFLDWEGIGGQKALVLDVEQGMGTIRKRVIEAGLSDRDDVIYAIAPDGIALDSDREAVKVLEELFLEHKPAVVLADPFYKLHRGDPNDMRAAVDLMRQFDAWRTQFEFALLLPMHLRGAPSQGRQKLTMDDIFGSKSYQWGAELVLGIEMKSRGYSHLHWWKDRDGELDVAGERWGLMFDRGHGFQRDPRDHERAPTRDRVKAALEVQPGLTVEELREKVEASHQTVVRALGDLAATHDGGRTYKDKHFTLPPSLFDGVPLS